MLYHLLYPLHTEFSIFYVFRFITFRTIYAAITALVISFLLGPWLIEKLSALQLGQTIRRLGPESHFKKEGTPTMGGALILFAIVLPTLLWADLTNMYVWLVLLVTVGYGVIGFVDDLLKIRKKNSDGLPPRRKMFWQMLIAFGVGMILMTYPGFQTTLAFPFFKGVNPDLGWFYVPFAMLVIIGASNAVNLTDGLDGLAIGPVIIAAGTYLLFAYVAGHATLITKQEIVLVIVGGIFVMEALSVIVQVTSFRLYGKRIFRMAPIHHHFELKGWPEPKIIVRFWIISIILALIGLSTMKLR